MKKLIENEKRIDQSNINLLLVAIGDPQSKNNFCSFTGLNSDKLYVVNHLDYHKELGLSEGINCRLPKIINMLLMCLGIKSPGTLKEVLRGYTGDKSAIQVFESNRPIQICKWFRFNSELFDESCGSGYQRPFELATLRLINMKEVLFNWNRYIPYTEFITQRGGTFLLDEQNQLLYFYLPKSLLLYSETMHRPLSFLDSWMVP